MMAIHRLCVALVLGALAGCSTPYKEPRLDPPNATFHGLAQIAAAEQGGALDLFVVHGMCHHGEPWAKDWLNLVAASLGTKAQFLADPPANPPAEIKVYRANMSLPRGTLRVHAIVWSGLTKPLKEQICYDQTHKSASCSKPDTYPPAAYPYERASLNARIKDDLLNECFADALIYQGSARLSIVQAMQAALLTSRASAVAATTSAGMSLARASLANDAGLVVLSSSLGSKLVFDSILELTKLSEDAAAAGAKLRDRTRQVFMASNQLPLLALADQKLPGAAVAGVDDAATKPGVFPPDSLGTLMRQRSSGLQAQGLPAPPALRVVAFTDPSDLLSYALRGYFKQFPPPENYEVIDVIVSNGPTVLGLLEDPYRAHTGYGHNEAVMSRIACGHPRGEKCW